MRVKPAPQIITTTDQADSQRIIANKAVPEVERPAEAQPHAERWKPQEVDQAVEKMNKAVQIFSSSLKFEVTDDRVVIKVIDVDSGEIIRQIPPEDLMESLRRVESAIGLILDRKV